MRVLSTILTVSLLPVFCSAQFIFNPLQFFQPENLSFINFIQQAQTKKAQEQRVASISMEEFKQQVGIKAQRSKGLQRELQFDEKGYVAFYPNPSFKTVIRTTSGTQIHLSDDFIQSCDPNAALEIQIEEFLTSDEIVASDASTYSKGQLLRSAGMVRLQIKGTKFNPEDQQSIKIYLPIAEIEGVQPFISKAHTDITKIDWDAMSEDHLFYDQTTNAYIVEVEQVTDGVIAINCDVAIEAQPYILKVKKKSGEMASPSVVFADGTITNLQPVSKLNKKNAKTQYFYFPAVHDQDLLIQDTYEDHKSRTNQLNTKIKLKHSKIKKMSKSGYVVLEEVVRYDGV